MDKKFDAIIIGSGLGGLTCASILAQLYKKRVLILERHFKIGGFTHTFKRSSDLGKYEWDVGLHYVGELAKGGMPRAVFDYVTGGGVKWQFMGDPYDTFVYPGLTFSARVGRKNFENDLIATFPTEKAAIQRYFVDLKKVHGWINRHFAAKLMPKWLSPISWAMSAWGAALPLLTTKAYLDSRFRDPKLKAVLASQWGDYGLPPAQSAFAVHALVTQHYFKGGYYPLGGSGQIAQSISPLVTAAGGELLVNHKVNRVLVQNARAVGVHVTHDKAKGRELIDKEYYADMVISNAGAHITYTQLIPPEIKLPPECDFKQFNTGVGHVCLYIGCKQDPRTIGFQGDNKWIFDDYDHDRVFTRRNALAEGRVSFVYVSFPSLKNPAATGHTIEIISSIDYDQLAQWADQPWKRRDEAYLQLKARISDALIDFVNTRFPGFRDIIDYHELSTPLTTTYFTGYPNGNFYGIPVTPERFRHPWLGTPLTPIKNLYLTGADAGVLGIMGALMSGVTTVGAAMGMPGQLMRIFSEAKKFSDGLPDE